MAVTREWKGLTNRKCREDRLIGVSVRGIKIAMLRLDQPIDQNKGRQQVNENQLKQV